MNCHSILEAGVGEARTLANVIPKMTNAPVDILGFDISWSRIAVAKRYSKAQNVNAKLFVGNLLEIPVLSNAIDVVYTSHSIEPNRGKGKEILSELYRITKHYLVLIEPSNELGSEQTRRRIEEHKYCKDLHKHAKELGLNVLEYRLFFDCAAEGYQNALMIIEKQVRKQLEQQAYFACPICKNSLIFHRGNYYCDQCFLTFPVIDDIPCLMSSHGILGSKYIQSAEED